MTEKQYDLSQETGEAIRKLLREAKNIEQYKRMQAVYFRSCYKEKAPKVAERTGLAIGTIWNIHNRWKRYGPHIFEIKNKGGRIREHLTPEEEKSFLQEFKKEGERGGILEVKVIHEAYKKVIGKNIAFSTTYRMLDRQNWRKIMPRPWHPKGEPEAQETFKKTGQISLKKQENKLKK